MSFAQVWRSDIGGRDDLRLYFPKWQHIILQATNDFLWAIYMIPLLQMDFDRPHKWQSIVTAPSHC